MDRWQAQRARRRRGKTRDHKPKRGWDGPRRDSVRMMPASEGKIGFGVAPSGLTSNIVISSPWMPRKRSTERFWWAVRPAPTPPWGLPTDQATHAKGLPPLEAMFACCSSAPCSACSVPRGTSQTPPPSPLIPRVKAAGGKSASSTIPTTKPASTWPRSGRAGTRRRVRGVLKDSASRQSPRARHSPCKTPATSSLAHTTWTRRHRAPRRERADSRPRPGRPATRGKHLR